MGRNELKEILKRFVFRGIVPLALLTATLIMSKSWLVRNPQFGPSNLQNLLEFVGVGLMPLVFASLYFTFRSVGVSIFAGSPMMFAIGILLFGVRFAMGVLMTLWRMLSALYYFPVGVVQLVKYMQEKRRVLRG